MIVALALGAPVACSSGPPNAATDGGSGSREPGATESDQRSRGVDEVVVGSEGARLGDIEVLGAEVDVSAGGFAVGDVLRAGTADVAADGLPGGWTPLTAGVWFVADREVARSDAPMTLRFAFDPAAVEDPGSVRIGYHHESHGWTWWRPDAVDSVAGVAEMEIYHFSTFALLAGDEAARVDEFIERRAVEQFIRRDAEERTESQITAMVEVILREGMDIGDSRIVEIISRAIVEQVPFGSIGLALYDADVDELVAATLDTTMDLIAKNADEDGAAAEWAGDWGTISAFVEAAREAAGGDPEAALRVMANEILDNVPLVSTVKQIGEVAVKVADHVITDLWFNPEVEKAFRVYRDGAEGGWFGYDVDPGDWEQLSGQMRGVFAKIRSDHLAMHCRAAGVDCAAMSADERNRIGDEAMELLRGRFADRLARQDEIDQIRAVEAQLFEQLAERGWLAQSFSNPMYAGAVGEDLDALLRRTGMMINRIKADTGRVHLVSDVDYDATDPFDRIDQRLLPLGAIEPLLQAWYSNPPAEREAAYRAMLDELGLLPEVVDRSGDDEDEEIVDEEDDSVTPVKFRVEFTIVAPMPREGSFLGGDDDVRNIVLTMWNVGTQQDGYGGVDTDGSTRTAYETEWPSGTPGLGGHRFTAVGQEPFAIYGLSFSGGPDGEVRTFEGELFGRLIDGTHFHAGPEALKHYLGPLPDPGPIPISDPSVFDAWR